MRPLLITCFMLGLVCPRLAADVIDLGKYPAKIVPEQVAVLNLPERGQVTDIPRVNRLKKGDTVAIVNRDQTADEREDMELALERERLNTRDEIRKLEAQHKQVSFYLNLTEGERKYATDIAGQEGGPPTREALRDIDDRLSLAKRNLSSMERRKRAEFERTHENLTLRMPFDGRIQYHVTLPENPDTPYEHTGANVQNFATVCDDSAFYITVSISGSELSTLPEHAFSAYVDLPEGKRISGTYAFRRVERSNSGSDILAYYFRLPKADHELAYNMLGSNSQATLLFDAGSDTKRVTKAELSRHPEAEQCESWRELVGRAYPDYNIVLITAREIVLRRKQVPPAPVPAP